MIAYIDDFWLMMWLTLAAVPMAFLMRRNAGPGKGPGPGPGAGAPPPPPE